MSEYSVRRFSARSANGHSRPSEDHQRSLPWLTPARVSEIRETDHRIDRRGGLADPANRRRTGSRSAADLEEPRWPPNRARYAQALHRTVSENFPGAQRRSAVPGMAALASAWQSWTDRASQPVKAIERSPPIRDYARWPLAHRPHQTIDAILVAAVAAALLLGRRSALRPAEVGSASA